MKINLKLSQFAAQTGRGLSRPLYKFLRDMLIGMVAKKSIMLSDVGRALNEDTDLLYTEKRLSRNVCSSRMDDSAIRQNYLRTVRRDTKNAIVAFDLSDCRKEYSKDQPFLAGIWDNTRKEKGYGYWLTQVEAVRPDGKHIPLWLDLWSQKAPDFDSQNAQIIRTLKTVSAHVDRSALWAFDRGFDNPKVMQACESLGLTYVIRQVGKRHLIGPDGEKESTQEIAMSVPMRYRFAWRRIRHGKKYPVEYRCGSAIVTFPDGKQRQLLVMHDSRWKKPIVTVTNSLDTRRKTVIRLCWSYLRRWSVEESIRAIKQCFELENLRALTWIGVQRMTLFAFLAWAFICKVAKSIRSKTNPIFQLHKSFGKTPDFFYYRLAEAIAILLLFGRASPPI